MDNDSQNDAIAGGRRIYLGNLLYTVNANDVENLLADSGFGNFEKVHMSIDSISNRNPGYCFVDFPDKASADRTLESLDASIGGRPLKVGPCEPKKGRPIRWGRDESSPQSSPQSQRWQSNNEWGSSRGGGDYQRDRDVNGQEAPQGDGKRLYVGGLPAQDDIEANQAEISQIFAGFNPATISKRITPHESTKLKPGNHHYCFLDFETKEEAEEARLKLDGIEYNGDLLKVRTAGPPPERNQRQGNNNSRFGDSPRQNRTPQADRNSEPSRSFASRDWRRRQD